MASFFLDGNGWELSAPEPAFEGLVVGVAAGEKPKGAVIDSGRWTERLWAAGRSG